MCDARRAALLLAVLTAPAARAQSLVELRHRADSLAGAWQEAEALANLADSIRRMKAAAGRDTVRAGALVVLANPSPLPLREAAERAWATLDGFYGDATPTILGRPFVLHVLADTAGERDAARRQVAIRADLQVPADLGTAELARVLVTSAPVHPPDEAVRQWLRGRLVPPVQPARERGAVYEELVTAPSSVVRRCFVGDLRECRDALGLAPGPDAFLRWYDAAQRRRLVAESFSISRGPTAPLHAACTAGQDTACTTLLRSLPPDVLPQPLSVGARLTLAQVTLERGGRAAYARLLANPAAPVADRLAAAAGVHLDSLVAAWRSEILAAQPAPVTLPVWGPVIAVAWTALFGACALRSSRWRAG